MANVLTRNIWTCDSLGIVSTGPVLVKAIMYYPNAVGNEFTLKWWNEMDSTLTARNITYTNILATADHNVKATTNAFPSTWLDGNVVKCLRTTGSDTRAYGLIKTAGDNDEFTVHLTPFTVEATKVGDWDCYPSYTAFRGKASLATDTETSMWFPFGGNGFWFPNLALDDCDTSDVVIIYVG